MTSGPRAAPVAITNQSQATPSDGSVEVGFLASNGAVDPAPANFTFDGVARSTGVVTGTT